ncbi:Ldh family oxidoreductase [Actinotalea sp. Marseille-Q4924]|uniref:Ldh family oxidoreductase n=1 Tax=Actinotalea sp. Marseille-Q4924 TaxID=2866571 RepID=UPI001CE455DC|nr:Ldh family oxidoreductase [Actinotalea sp. Marseille-Q4924]
MSAETQVVVAERWLSESVRRVFEAEGFSPAAAGRVADVLVGADLAGVTSHGTMLVPMYVDRLRTGSVSRREEGEVVHRHGAVAVLDAHHALGQLTGHQAMALAIESAGEHGLGMTVVRHAFHFGRASSYAEQAAAAGCIGIAMSNTRPLMPAPGGAEPVVGNNPLAIVAPTPAGPVALDMALSEAALGKIRLAEAAGTPIPETWATDAAGNPTTDAAEAVAGMLLPTGGPKGFGLALMVDVLTGVLSGGASGAGVRGLYADMSVPNDCAHMFLAIHVGHFGDAAGFDQRVGALMDFVVGSRPRDGVPSVVLPGQRESERAQQQRAEGVVLPRAVLEALRATADEVGASLPEGAAA